MTEGRNKKPPENPMPPIATIAASAGGLAATKKLLQHMPPDCGIALVVIHHLAPDHESMIPELLQAVTEMEVAEVGTAVKPEPNHVYTIPPNKYLEVKDGFIAPVEPTAQRGHRMAVDHFLRSLAKESGTKAMCMILSGTGTDGSLGLKEINEAGGLVLAQNPEQAEFKGMPTSAISTQMVDRVLDAEQMPNLLIDFIRSGGLKQEFSDKEPHKIQDHLEAILTRVRKLSGRDFSRYKKATLLRRIHRRMALARITNPEYYLDLLDNDSEEIHALFKDLLISVTRFFRDADVFKHLARKVLPGLCSRLHDDDPLRIWVPGVATGEEAYTLAILIQEHYLGIKKPCSVVIFATDIDTEALNVAREGRYPQSIEHDVSLERLERFFVAEGDHYRVNRDTRKMVTFAEQDILADPPYSRLDLISCRNLMIYLGQTVQQKTLALFHFALKPEGVLVLGTSETVGRHMDHLFKSVDSKMRIYRRIGGSRRLTGLMPNAPSQRHISTLTRGPKKKEKPPVTGIEEQTRRAILDHITTCTVVVDRSMSVLYVTGPTAPYLTVPTGRMQNILPLMTANGLQIRVRQVLQKVIHGDEPEARATGRLSVEKTDYRVIITARPLIEEDQVKGGDQDLFVCFFDRREILPSPAPETISNEQEANRRIAELEYTLKENREELNSTIEELEMSNEELRASNEEIISINEELQSSSEELETSKEELQSLNEELTTLNNQLQEKVEELTRAHDDMENLLESTEIATVFLDRNLSIRQTTPSADNMLNTRPADEGRPLAHFATPFRDINLLDEAEKVLSQQETSEYEIQTHPGRWFNLRIMPYRTGKGEIDGVVLTMVDVHRLKKTQHELEDREQRLRLALEGGHMATWEFDPATGRVQWDRRMCRLLDLDPDDPPKTAEAFYKHIHSEDRPAVQKEVEDALSDSGKYTAEFRVQNEEGDIRWLAGRGRVFYDENGRPSRMLGVNFDITESKEIGRALAENEQRLRLAIQAMHGMVYEWDLDAGSVRRSEGLQGLVGMPLSELAETADAWDRLIHPDDRDRVKEIIREALAGDEDRFELVYRVRHASGHDLYLHDHGIIDRSSDGRAGRVVGSAYDITDRKMAEEELKRLNEELEQRVADRTEALRRSREEIRHLAHLASTAEERERRRIAEGLHDNVQQLLAACTFSLQGLNHGLNEAEVKKRVDKIMEWSNQALDATRSLIFDLSPAVLYEVGLEAAVDHLVSQTRERFGLQVELNQEGDIDPLPEGLRVFLYSAVRELIFNVSKHADIDSAKIWMARKDKQLQIHVTDHGRGFKPAELDRMREQRNGDYGLGLITLEERLGSFGGDLDLTSAPGEGTNIRITVPAYEENSGLQGTSESN